MNALRLTLAATMILTAACNGAPDVGSDAGNATETPAEEASETVIEHQLFLTNDAQVVVNVYDPIGKAILLRATVLTRSAAYDRILDVWSHAGWDDAYDIAQIDGHWYAVLYDRLESEPVVLAESLPHLTEEEAIATARYTIDAMREGSLGYDDWFDICGMTLVGTDILPSQMHFTVFDEEGGQILSSTKVYADEAQAKRDIQAAWANASSGFVWESEQGFYFNLADAEGHEIATSTYAYPSHEDAHFAMGEVQRYLESYEVCAVE